MRSGEHESDYQLAYPDRPRDRDGAPDESLRARDEEDEPEDKLTEGDEPIFRVLLLLTLFRDVDVLRVRVVASRLSNRDDFINDERREEKEPEELRKAETSVLLTRDEDRRKGRE